MIDVQNLTKRYGERTAVNNVSFHVSKGEVIGFLGPNGAGKSTTMRMLTGFLSPTSGSVKIGGFNMSENPLEAKRLLGYLPELPPLYHEMTVRDYLDFVGQLKGLSRTQRKDRLEYCLEKCFLKDRRNQLIQTLSKGYKQRVGIAQALIHNPPVLILDEPTSGLDPAQIIQIRSLIKELAVEHTIILSTHILPEVQNTCSRVLIISNGQVAAEGNPEELEAQLQGGMRISVTVRGPQDAVAARVKEIAGGATVVATPRDGGLVTVEINASGTADVREQLASTIVGAGWGLVELKSVNLSLEEIFLKLTTTEPTAAVQKETLNV
ncbi:MAG: yxlF 1 [Cyanobacteria bacterium RYN_339]|nr:yxlF 1 [Cyanobacteria bacterium RYN_339]